MQLTRDNSTATYQIKSYQPGCITINDQDYHHSILIMPHLLQPWSVPNIETLWQEHFAELLDLQPDVILIGTGAELKFPAEEILLAARNLPVAVEFMSSAAACRSFVVLSAEGRKVLGAVVV